MFDKKNIIILATVAIVSFGGALVVSMLIPKDVPMPPAGQGSAKDAVADMIGPSGVPAGVPVNLDPTRRQLHRLIVSLRQEKNEVEEMKRKLRLREKRIKIAEESLVRRAKDVQALEMALTAPLKRLDEKYKKITEGQVSITREDEIMIRHMAAKHEKMSAEACAKIIERMWQNQEHDDVVKLMTYMDIKKAAKVMNQLDVDIAAAMNDKWKRVRIPAEDR